MSRKLTHDFSDAMWRVRRDTGVPLSVLRKAFMHESNNGAHAVGAHRFQNDVSLNYHPAKALRPILH